MRPEKLLQRIIDGSRENVRFSDFVRLVQWLGFRESRQRGSHRFFVHDKVDEVLNLQPKGKDAKPYQINQFLDILERYDISVPGDRS